MALPSGEAQKGEKGLAIFPERVQDFRASVEQGLEYAEVAGCRLVHVMAGVRPRGVPESLLWRTYLENIEYTSHAARDRDIDLLIEPIGRGTIENYFIDHPNLVLEAIAAIGQDNIFILLDFFHAARAGVEIAPFIRQHAALIRHVQIADFPCRHEPGTGSIDFAAAFGALDAVGYRSFIGCEYVPENSTEAGLAWLKAL